MGFSGRRRSRYRNKKFEEFLFGNPEKHFCGDCIPEVLPRTCLGNTSKEMLEIAEGLDGLKVVVDTNHIMQEKESDCIRMLANRLIGLHVSDRDEINERHWIPGEGIVDFQEILAALEEIGYKGFFTYEVAKMKTAEDVKNVVDNYNSLFAAYNDRRK